MAVPLVEYATLRLVAVLPVRVKTSLVRVSGVPSWGLLRAVRQEAGLSQVVLAERLGTTQNYVSKSESGERRVDALEWLRWLAACGADPVTFLVRWNRELDPPVPLSLPVPRPPQRRRASHSPR